MSPDGALPASPIQSRPIWEEVYAILVDRITSGLIEPGAKLEPAVIAQELGVSSTPVRDALKRLEIDHMVNTRPRSGTYLVTPGVNDVREVCQLRRALEGLSTGVAATAMPRAQVTALREQVNRALDSAVAGDYDPFFKSDHDLHHAMIATTENSRFVAAYSTVAPFVAWLRVLGATGTHRIAGSTQRHLEILQAVDDHDAEGARYIAELHLAEVEKWTIEDMANSAAQVGKMHAQ